MASRLTLTDMQSMAAHYGGRCLSNEYINDSTLLQWMCEKGHRWEGAYNLIMHGQWCRQCIKDEVKRMKLEQIKKIIEAKGGECLSEKYINNYTKLKFKCGNGHLTFILPKSIFKGGWCGICYRKIEHAKQKAYTVEELQSFAEMHDGKMLSLEYISNQKPLLWQCNKGHRWYSGAKSVLASGFVCRVCLNKNRSEIAFEKTKQIIKSHYGKLLSENISSYTKYIKVCCSKKHEWDTTPQRINVGKWCPVCARTKNKSS